MPTAKPAARKRKRPVCKACGRPIYVPRGWSDGAAARRHYWRRHREVMQPERKRRST